jgi:hypothetical protein
MHIGEPQKVLIYRAEADRLGQLTFQYSDIETGGDLFGYWTHSGSPVVSYVVGPGQRSRHHRTSFYQDEGYLHDIGTDLYDQHGLQHVGEWHSHHRLGLNEPSQGDMDTVRSGMRQRGWSRFLLVITTITGEEAGSVLQNYFLFMGQASPPEPLRILCLRGTSPFRRPELDDREEKRRRGGEVSWRPGPSTPGVRRLADEVFKGAWFATTDGKALLVRAAKLFASAGISCRMVPAEDGQSVKLVLPDAALLLGSRFPTEPPQWVGSRQPSHREPWSPSTELVDWYLEAKEKDASEAREDRERD